MKKILFLIFFWGIFELFAQVNIKKVSYFNNIREEGSLLKRNISELVSEFDETGNGIIIDEIGNIYIIQCDMHLLYNVDLKDNKLKLINKIDFLENGIESLRKITDKYYYCSGPMGRFKLLDKKFNPLFNINLMDWGLRIDTRESYYDEKTDILFFRDAKSNMHSIIHPGLDDKKNRNNYKTPAETLEIFNSNYDMKHLGLYKGKYLTVDGQVYYWAGTTINHINYQIYDNKEVDIWNDDELEIQCTSPNEEMESIAIHPSGDIYILRMNWQTNTHNLYYIENTWDSEWREQWYKEHPDAIRP